MMSEEELVRIISEKLERALNAADGGISQRRRDMLDRYLGARDGTERAGYSSFTTREVLEAVEWAMPALMRIFTGGDKYVVFDAVGEEDEAAAEQETDVVNHLVQKSNGGEGFLALYSFIKDALINPTAYAKVWVDKQKRSTVRKVASMTEQDLAMLAQREDVEILEQDSSTIQVPITDPMSGLTNMADVEVFDVRYKQTDERPRLRIMSLPGEEVLVDDEFTEMDLDRAYFKAHRARKTFSELVRMGIDPDELNAVGSGVEDDAQWNDERTHRLFYEDEHPDDEENELDETMRTFWVHEVFMDVDYDEDGIAERRTILMIGRHVFENEEEDYQPLISMASSVVPHKHTGLSLAEMVEDLQRLLTTLTRQLLDNTYKTNTNRKFFSEDSLLDTGETMDAMLDPQSEYVPVRGDVRAAVVPENPINIQGEILPVIQHSESKVSMRTGVAPENNVDPNVLQQSTYGAFMGAMEKAGERIEMIARVMAETGIKQVFRKVHVLCRTHPDIAQTVKLRGEWVSIDPMSWQERTDMTASVGLGVVDKQQMTNMLISLLEIQKEALAMGLAGPEQIYNALEKLVEGTGMGQASQFFMDPTSPDWQPPQPEPDPQAQLYEAQAQAVLMEQERKQGEAQVNAQIETSKQGLEQEKSAHEIEQKGVDTNIKWAELAIKRHELKIKERELDLREMEMSKMGADVDNTDADTELKGAQVIKTLADADASEAKAEATLNPPEPPASDKPDSNNMNGLNE